MPYDQFIEALNILKKYFINTSGYHMTAEHDTFYVYGTDHPVSPEDYATLKKMGWGQVGDSVVYDPKASWFCFL